MSSSQTLQFQINFGPTLGALLIGIVLGAIFLGITCLQTAFYYRTYPQDTIFMKVLVGVLWKVVLDVSSLILWTHAGYTYLITNYGNLAVADSLVWSVAVSEDPSLTGCIVLTLVCKAEPPVTGLIALSVHLFLSWRIQILDHRWRIPSIAIALVAFASFSLVITAATLEFAGIKHSSSISTVVQQVEWYTLAGDLSASIIVLTISGSISFLLYRGRSGFSQTNRILTKLTLYIVASGAITSILRVLDLILSRSYPNSMYFLIPYISSSKAYTNALLATLNSRASRRNPLASRPEAIELRNSTYDSVNVAIKSKSRGSNLSNA
ncbi:hypothetical protein OG21DRAFT_1497745 [Imleria badia]|nr:hypothetical protein OG21DRAFT_1497745 [Imleria badia]